MQTHDTVWVYNIIVKVDSDRSAGGSRIIMGDSSFETSYYAIADVSLVASLDREIALCVKSTEGQPKDGRTSTSILNPWSKTDVLLRAQSALPECSRWIFVGLTIYVLLLHETIVRSAIC